MNTSMSVPLVEMRDVHKRFGHVVALRGVHFTLLPGEIHGLLGGNGAGKTTLMNILFGLYTPDRGEIAINGRRVVIRSPRDALALGIGMVHQHFLQVAPFTVVENIALGTLPHLGGRRHLRTAADRIRSLAARFGLEVDPEAIVEDLPVGVRQRVEILKALYRGVKVLILDEPTTNLTPQEVDVLFRSLRTMVAQGLSVIFITHKIREVMAVCDRITVLREGANVFTVPRSAAREEELVRGMVGEAVDVQHSFLFASRSEEPTPTFGMPLIQVEALDVMGDTSTPAVQQCTFSVREGEIFGVAGVAGNGQRELAEALMGIRPISAGRAVINGYTVHEGCTAELLNREVAYIPEDRLEDGYLPVATVAHNIVLGHHRRPPYARGLFLQWHAILKTTWQLIREYSIRTSGPTEIAANLSGGNIQRLMLARAFAHPFRVTIAHNPTRGLDIPSTEFVYRQLLAARSRGAAILLISEDLDELLLLCDRIGTLYKGRLMGVLERPQFDKYLIGRMMAGMEGPSG